MRRHHGRLRPAVSYDKPHVASNTADEATLQEVVVHVATDTLEQVRARLGLA
jgi:hypothetical protein